MNKNSQYFDILITAVCLFIAYALHTQFFLDADVAWHVEGAQRLLAGGHYLSNVFDDNSPFVFAFYFPVIWFHQFSAMNYTSLILVYNLTVIAALLLLLHYICAKRFLKQKTHYFKLAYYSLVYILLFLPTVSLGQREMILINFTLPYFLIVTFLTQCEKLKFNSKIIFFCAILAAIGVMQNIIFLFVFIAIDLFRFIKTKKFASFQLVFYGVVVIECFIIGVLYPEYPAIIIPLLLCYTSGFNSNTIELILYPYIVWFSLLLTLVQLKRLMQEAEILMLAIASFISLLIYLFERKIWYSHLYPSLVFALLLLVFLVIKSAKSISSVKKLKFNINVVTICFAVAIFFTMLRSIIISGLYEIKQFNNPNSVTRKWVVYAQQHFSNKKVFYLIVNDDQGFTLPLYDNSTAVSPWFNPWFIPYILQNEKRNMGFFCNPDRDTKLFIYIISRAIATNHPDFIVIKIPKPLITLEGFNRIFTEKNIVLLFKDYAIYDYLGNNIIYKRITSKD